MLSIKLQYVTSCLFEPGRRSHETHGQNHPKSKTESTSDPIKWTLVRQKLFKNYSLSNFSVQIVGMSATLPNVGLLARWLKADLYHTDYRPVPLAENVKISRTIYNNQMQKVRDIDVSKAIKVANVHILTFDFVFFKSNITMIDLI